MPPDHERTLSLLGPEHLAYFDGLPTSIALPEHGAVVIHAGAYPGVAIADQDRYHLLHIQCVLPPARRSYWASKAPPGHPF